MNSMEETHHIPVDVRAAIQAFLKACQEEATPFATEEAIGAVRRVFPDLEISDGDLMDAITSEASAAGFDVGADAGNISDKRERKSLERWDDEGGAIGRPIRTEAERMIDNDTSGARRRTKATRDRSEPI